MVYYVALFSCYVYSKINSLLYRIEIMKKYINILLVNIFISIFLFILLDSFLLYSSTEIKMPNFTLETERTNNPLDYDKSKKAIITTGCSFTFGDGIEQRENFAYKLQKLTKRKVINRSILAIGPQHVLRDIQQYKEEIFEPEYIIYTFISDHIRRIYVDYFDFRPRSELIQRLYNIKNNKLVLRNNKEATFFDRIRYMAIIKRLNFILFKLTPDDKKFDRLKLYITTMKEEAKKNIQKLNSL